jgi:hypothetical protein
MSRSAEISLPFGDDHRNFRLGLKELQKLQERCADKVLGERGPFQILQALIGGTWRMEDVVETIRLGLIGGGMKPEDAGKLITERFEDRVGLYEHALTAAAILRAAMIGPEDDKLEGGKDPPGEAEAELPTGPSASPTSSDRPQSSGGPPETSIN